MHRFFIRETDIEGQLIAISGSDAKHIREVLRMKPGDKLELVSELWVYSCEITQSDRSKVEALILSRNNKMNEPKLSISLYQGLPKSAKMEYILQKCTEIGVKRFCPVITGRSVVRITDIKKEEKKLDRWRQVLEESAKQSMRDIVPELTNIMKFEDMLKDLEGKTILVPYEEEEERTLTEFFRKHKGSDNLAIVIGPEGGFEETEIERLKDAGAEVVTLGRRILRTETAGLVVASICLYEHEDLGVIK